VIGFNSEIKVEQVALNSPLVNLYSAILLFSLQINPRTFCDFINDFDNFSFDYFRTIMFAPTVINYSI
jgi:hypothetical protein